MSDDKGSEEHGTKVEPSPEFLRMLVGASKSCEDLGLPRDFLFKLIDYDDWTFVLRLHAVLDAALEQAIVKSCFVNKWTRLRDDSKIEKICAGLRFEGRVSKLSFAEAFSLCSAETQKVMKALNTLRNLFAHDLSHLNSTIEEVLAEKGQKGLLPVLVQVPDLEPETPQQLRLYIAITGMRALWEVRFLSKPPRGLLSFDGNSDDD
jgi:hypothetical protein